MNCTLNIIKLALLNILALAVAIVFWPYAIAGLFAFAICGMKFHRWVSSCVALIYVVAGRIINGEWRIKIGDSPPYHWYFEILLGIVSWALAAIIISAFAQWPSEIIKGYRSSLITEPKATH
jgi:hypothetical protein